MVETQKQRRSGRRRQLEEELAELLRSLPAHSLSPTMQLRVEEIEDEMARLDGGEDDGPSDH